VNKKITITLVTALFLSVGVLGYLFFKQTLSPVQIQNENELITIESEIQGVIPSFSDSTYLDATLSELNLWNGEKRIYETAIRTQIPISALHIILTTKEQAINQTIDPSTDPPSVYQSAGIVLDESTKSLYLYLHLSQEMINTTSEKSLEQVFSKMALRRLYGVKNDVDNNQDVDYAQNGQTFIRIKK